MATAPARGRPWRARLCVRRALVVPRAQAADADGELVSRRRAVWLKAAFALAEAVAVPTGTEYLTRPRAANAGVSGPADALKSLLPAAPYGETEAGAARAALSAAAEAEATGEWAVAVERYTYVLDTVPLEYKACQRARLGRAEAYAKLGDRERAGADGADEWWWGRGVRWPGHYIIAYLSARSAAYSKLRLDAEDAGWEDAELADAEARYGSVEFALVLVGAVVYNVLLARYGLSDL